MGDGKHFDAGRHHAIDNQEWESTWRVSADPSLDRPARWRFRDVLQGLVKLGHECGRGVGTSCRIPQASLTCLDDGFGMEVEVQATSLGGSVVWPPTMGLS